MTQTVADALRQEMDRIRLEVMETQRTCWFCMKNCEDADHLYFHLVLRHSEEVVK